ncbi:MAG TPA: response regulator [Candidatus Acidoferrales bacterium]
MPRRALIVDDEPAVCQLIQGVLTSSGLDALTLTKSADATGYLRDEKFDVVLLDFSMPAPSGIELAQQARGSGFMTRLQRLIRVTQGAVEQEILSKTSNMQSMSPPWALRESRSSQSSSSALSRLPHCSTEDFPHKLCSWLRAQNGTGCSSKDFSLRSTEALPMAGFSIAMKLAPESSDTNPRGN